MEFLRFLLCEPGILRIWRVPSKYNTHYKMMSILANIEKFDGRKYLSPCSMGPLGPPEGSQGSVKEGTQKSWTTTPKYVLQLPFMLCLTILSVARFVALLKLLLLEGQKRLYFSLDSSLYNLSFDSTSNTTPFNVRWPGNHSHARTIRALVKRFLVLLKWHNWPKINFKCLWQNSLSLDYAHEKWPFFSDRCVNFRYQNWSSFGSWDLQQQFDG